MSNAGVPAAVDISKETTSTQTWSGIHLGDVQNGELKFFDQLLRQMEVLL